MKLKMTEYLIKLVRLKIVIVKHGSSITFLVLSNNASFAVFSEVAAFPIEC